MKKYLILLLFFSLFSCEIENLSTKEAVKTSPKIEYVFGDEYLKSEADFDEKIKNYEVNISFEKSTISPTCNPVTNCLIAYWIKTYPNGSTVIEYKMVAFTISPNICNSAYFIIENNNTQGVIFVQQNNMIFYNGHDDFLELLDWAQNDCDNLNVVCPNCNNQ